jgi:hypothetical protein
MHAIGAICAIFIECPRFDVRVDVINQRVINQRAA